MNKQRQYWNAIAGDYQSETFISTDDFHYGPMIPGDRELKLLPKNLKGLKCLEIGCGAAQNSIYLAKRGAVCTAFDIAEMQLALALEMIREEKVKLQLHRLSMDSKWKNVEGTFDLIHSVFGLSFSKKPENVIKQTASLLNKGGRFIFSIEHPLSASEKIELEEEKGVFISDYLNPLPEIRVDENDEEIVRSNTYPIGLVTEWLSNAGFALEKLVEPKPRIVDLDKIPYVSEAWQEELAGFEGIPPVVIFSAILL